MENRNDDRSGPGVSRSCNAPELPAVQSWIPPDVLAPDDSLDEPKPLPQLHISPPRAPFGASPTALHSAKSSDPIISVRTDAPSPPFPILALPTPAAVAGRYGSQSDSFLFKVSYRLGLQPAPTEYRNNVNSVVVKIILIYIIQYTLLFAFQLLMYFVGLRSSEVGNWYVGLALGLVSLCLSGLCVMFTTRRMPSVAGAFLLLDFLMFALATAWGCKFLDFSLLSTSYLVVTNFAVLLVNVYCFKIISFWAFVIVLGMTLLSTVGLTIGISRWYYDLPVMIYIVCHLTIVNYELKNIVSYARLQSSDYFRTRTFAYAIRYWLGSMHVEETAVVAVGSIRPSIHLKSRPTLSS